MPAKISLIGQRFGKLKVVADDGVRFRNRHYVCQCDCGNTSIVRRNNLMSGTISCGCMQGARPGYIQHATLPMGFSDTFDERFWSYVQKTEKCWLWVGKYNSKGYGTISKGGRNGEIIASRASWIFYNGPIPDGLFVLHECDNPPCVRPDHLFLGTQLDNVADMCAKGRQARGEQKKKSHKLTTDQVIAIRSSSLSQHAQARAYGVSVMTINCVVLRKTWKHI